MQSFKDEWYLGHRLTALLLQRRQLLILKRIRPVAVVVNIIIIIIIKIQMNELITPYNLTMSNNLYCKLKNQRIKLLRRLSHPKLMLMIILIVIIIIILMRSQLRWWWNKLRMMIRARSMMMNNLISNNNKIMIMIMMLIMKVKKMTKIYKIQLDMMVMEHRTLTSIIQRRSSKTFCKAVIFFKSTLLTIFIENLK